MLFKKCIICGNKFTAKYPSLLKARKYCGEKCAVIGVPQTQRKTRGGVTKVCVECGKGFHIRKSHEGKRKTCSLSCAGKQRSVWSCGRINTIETRLKMSIAGLKRVSEGRNNFWRGGVTEAALIIRASLKYRLWRESVLLRDKYTCQICGVASTKGHFVLMHADHIKPFALFPELRLELSNGRTLCVPCHRKTDTWGYSSAKIVHQKSMA